MRISENYKFNMPMRNDGDIVDVDVISENFEKIDGLIKTNEVAITQLGETTTSQGTLLGNVRAKVATHGSSIAELRIQVGDLESATSTNAEHIEALTASVTTNTEVIAANAEKIETNRTGLLNVNSKVQVNENNIVELQSAVEDLQSGGISTEKIEELESKIETNRTGLLNVKSNVTTNTNNIAINTSDIEALTASVASNAESIATNAKNIATNAEKIADNQYYINLLARYNAIGWLSDINAYSTMIDNVKYSWMPSTGQLNVVCNNTAATSYDFVTLDLTSPNLKGQTITLDVVGGSGTGVYAFYTAVNSSGVMTTHSVINESISWTYGSIDTLTIAIKTANGYKGQMMLRLTVTTGKSHKELISSITAVSDRVTALEETGGATGADGKSAYEIWLEQGNTGTVDDFLASLVGESITITDTELIITDGGATKTKLTFSDGTEITISDGANGAKGADGDDGKSIEITNIELSEEDGGENKITFSDGELDSVIVIRNGNKGSTPVKGEDYFTDADKTELISSTELEDKIKAVILARDAEKYPVGSLYLSMIEINPADILGFGTWQLVGANRMIMGATNSSQAGDLGGYESHTHETAFRFASWYNEVVLENHEETGIMAYEPNGSKTATGNTRVAYTSVDSENNYYNASTETSRTASGQMGVYESVGNTSYEPNTPPYIKVNLWQRTA